MGYHEKHEDGTYSISFGSDTSEGVGGGGGINLPAGDYVGRVLRDVDASKADNNQRRVDIQALVLIDPSGEFVEEVDNLSVPEETVSCYLTLPDNDEDGEDKKVRWMWVGYLEAQEVSLDDLESDDLVDINDQESEGLLVTFRINERTRRDGTGKQRQAFITGPPPEEYEGAEAEDEEDEEEEEEQVKPKPKARTAKKTEKKASSKKAAKKTSSRRRSA